MVQPQPYGDNNFQWDMAGEEAVPAGGQGSLMNSSQGSLRVPPELAGNEVVHRLMMDNNQLRDALKRSNNALKERCEEMEGWQQRTKREREFLNCKIQEARALVERLVIENHSLLGKLGAGASQIVVQSSCVETGSQTKNQEDFPAAFGVADRKDGAEEETERQTMPRSLPSEGSNEFLRLLKSHKEKLEEGMKELRRRNDELEREKMESEKEKKELMSVVEQLHLQQTQQSQTVAVTENAFQNTNAYNVSPERYKRLLDQLNVLQENSMQRDRNEVQLKQKEKECIQLTKDIVARSAQVTSLVGELQECQSSLRKSEEDKGRLEEELSSKTEELKTKDLETQQHSVAMDKLLMQKQNLEAALKTERLVVVEERRKLAQLQQAYTCLFKDYEKYIRGGDFETVNKRLEDAEKALALKQALIDKLKEDVEQQRTLQETNEVLTAQADIYKSDFLAERRAREELNQKKEELQEKLNQAQGEINLLKQKNMQERHMDSYRPPLRLPPPVAALAVMPGPAMSQPNRNHTDMQPDFECPKCRYVAPDMDTLQIHVMDCIQ